MRPGHQEAAEGRGETGRPTHNFGVHGQQPDGHGFADLRLEHLRKGVAQVRQAGPNLAAHDENIEE